MRLWLYRGAQIALFGSTVGVGAWGLAQQPFVAPLVERSADSAARALEAAFRNQFTPGWVTAELDAALRADDTPRVLWLADLAAAEGLALDPALAPRVAELRAAREGWLTAASDCAVCAWDIQQCQTLGQIAACAVPVELTPLGDLNALRRQGMAAASGQEIDRLETGLALLGLAATGAVVASGGGTMVVKAGASVLRTARRMGSLTPGLTRALRESADVPVNWGAVWRAAPLDQITDTARLARLGDMAGDMGRMARQTSVGETLVLLRHVDTPEDLARMARLSETAGARTLSRVEVLGKARAFRTMTRLSNLALGTIAALYAAALQVLLMLGGGLGRGALRLLRPR